MDLPVPKSQYPVRTRRTPSKMKGACTTAYRRWAGAFACLLKGTAMPSISPVTRKAVRCSRETAWLTAQVTAQLIASTADINAPTPSAALTGALERVAELENAAAKEGRTIDYAGVMSLDTEAFCEAAGLPQAPATLADERYMFTLSGKDLIADIYRWCPILAERTGAAQVKPAQAVRLALRIHLLDAAGTLPYAER